MGYRIEEKYRLTRSEQAYLKKKLFDNGLSTLYPPRSINSCYFDTNDLRTFFDSDEGSLPRKKIRFRWYENDNVLAEEVKISSVEGRYKTIKKFNDEGFSKTYEKIIYDQMYGLLKPSLLIKYLREYYILNNLRITFDKNITYTDLRGLTKKRVIDPECVMEIKTSAFTSQDFIKKIFNYPTSRFSKYCRGILLLNKSL